MNTSPQPAGYHLRTIPRGEVGELTKVAEELAEALDAEEQAVQVMVILELSDLVGAIELYLEKHQPGITLDDLIKMARVTQRAFRSGARA